MLSLHTPFRCDIYIYIRRNVTLTSMTVCLLFEQCSHSFTLSHRRDSQHVRMGWIDGALKYSILVHSSLAMTHTRSIYIYIHMCSPIHLNASEAKESNSCSMFSLRFFWSAECEMLFTWMKSVKFIQSKRAHSTTDLGFVLFAHNEIELLEYSRMNGEKLFDV